nr:MATE family efflux transporter [uncultured Romboutsia sp.]
MTENFLETEKLGKLFLKYTIPSIVGMIFVGVQGIIDGLFVGNIMGENALASINLCQPVLQLIMGIALVFSVGGQSIIGINLGKKNIKEAQDTFKTALLVLLVISVIASIFGVFFSDNIAKLLGANEILLEGTSTYIRYISLFTIFIMLMFTFDSVVRTIGKPHISLVGLVIAVIINIILDYLFIAKLKMGIKGAALATGISYSISMFIIIFPFLNKNSNLNIYIGKFNKKVIIPMAYNGASEGISSLSTALSMFLFNTALMKISGESGIAAFTIINYISQVGYMIIFGISDGVRPIISYSFGSDNHKRLKEVLKLSVIVNVIIGFGIFIVMSMFCKDLIGLFLKDGKNAIDIAVSGSRIYGIAFLFNGLNILASGYFTAIDDAKSSIIIAISRGLVFILIGILILPIIFGINGVWGTVVFAEILTLVICFYIIKKKYSIESNLALQSSKEYLKS